MYGAEAFPRTTTGTDLVVASNRMMTTTGSGGPMADVQPMSPMETMKEVFFEIRDSLTSIAENTLKTANLLEKSAPTPAEMRDDKINAGETDSQGNDNKEQGPSFLERLSGLNPVKAFSGLGTFGKFLVAIGALVGLKLFGDKLVPGIAKLLQFIKEGKLTEKIEEIYTDFSTKAVAAFESLKEGTIRFIEGVKGVITIIRSAYEMVEQYIMSFDTQGAVGPAGMPIGDGKLDPIELGNLKKDVIQRISDAVVAAVGNIVGQLADGIRGIFLLPLTLGVAISAIKNMIIGPKVKPPQGPTKGGTPVKAKGGLLRGILGKAGLVAAITFGIFELIDKSKEAYADAITDEMGNKQNFDFSEMIGSFFGGDGKGIFNSFGEMFKQGAIGTAIGAGLGLTLAKLGFVIGTPFGPLGMGTGALLGFLVGSLIGAIGGYFGGEKISKMIDDMGKFLDDLADSAYFFVADLFDNFKNFFTGGASKKAADEVRLNNELEDLEEDLVKAEEKLAINPNNHLMMKKVENIKADIVEKKAEIANVPVAQAELAEGFTLKSIKDQIELSNEFIRSRNFIIDEAKAGRMFGINIPEEERLIKEEEEKLKGLEAARDRILAAGGTSVDMTSIPAVNRIKQTGGDASLAEEIYQKNPNVFANNNNQLSQIFKEETHSHGGLSSGDNFMTAVMAANKNAKMQIIG